MATAADALSRDWVHRAKEAGNEAVQRLEQDAGECLMDCCAKDVRQQAFDADLTAQLARLDPTRTATRARQVATLPATDPAPPQPSAHAPSDPHDAELQELRAKMLTSMQRRKHAAVSAAAAGYGSLVDVTAAGAEALLFDADVPAAVCHLWLPGLAAELDEALALLALDSRGTRVVRAPAARAGALLRRLRRPEGAWLVAARRGRVVGIVAADGGGAAAARGHRAARPGARGSDDESSDFGSSDEDQADWVEGTTAWLQRLGVLIKRPRAVDSAARGEAGSSSGEEGGEGGEANELGDPCPLCGRTYFHVHKRAVRQGGPDGYISDE